MRCRGAAASQVHRQHVDAVTLRGSAAGPRVERGGWTRVTVSAEPSGGGDCRAAQATSSAAALPPRGLRIADVADQIRRSCTRSAASGPAGHRRQPKSRLPSTSKPVKSRTIDPLVAKQHDSRCLARARADLDDVVVAASRRTQVKVHVAPSRPTRRKGRRQPPAPGPATDRPSTEPPRRDFLSRPTAMPSST